jgi:hypothetical protein
MFRMLGIGFSAQQSWGELANSFRALFVLSTPFTVVVGWSFPQPLSFKELAKKEPLRTRDKKAIPSGVGGHTFIFIFIFIVCVILFAWLLGLGV